MGVINTKFATMTVSARAVSAAGQSSPTCVCLEGTTGTDLNLSNNAKLTPSGCGTTVDSNSSNAVTIVGSATLGGLSIGSVSTNWDTSSNVNNGGTIATGTKVVEGISTSMQPAFAHSTNLYRLAMYGGPAYQLWKRRQFLQRGARLHL